MWYAPEYVATKDLDKRDIEESPLNEKKHGQAELNVVLKKLLMPENKSNVNIKGPLRKTSARTIVNLNRWLFKCPLQRPMKI